MFHLKQEIIDVYNAPLIEYTRLETLKVQLQFQYMLEEEYWRTKSRILQLQTGTGTRGTSTPKQSKLRRHYNRIIQLQDDQEKLYSKVKDVWGWKHIKNYFRSLYTSNGCTLASNLLNVVPATVTEEINMNLTSAVIEEEVKNQCSQWSQIRLQVLMA